MSQFSELEKDTGPVYVREKGHLFLAGSHSLPKKKSCPVRTFSKGFSVELCVKQEDTCKRKEKPFIFTYTDQGSLRYSAKPLFILALDLIADNVQHVDSLLGFPEQIAEKLFTAAEARQQFCKPNSGLVALQKFTDAYGDLMLSSLCLRGKHLLVSEKLEAITSFQGLHRLDLSSCKLGDAHELLEHITSEALNSLRELYLKDNCLSDIGVRKMTAPLRVLNRGLGCLTLLDLSSNQGITDVGVKFLLVFNQLHYLDISDTGVQDPSATCKRIETRTGLHHAKKRLTQFDHVGCRTQGWAEQLFRQWDQFVESAIKPKEILKTWTGMQQFYGKEKVNRPTVEKCIPQVTPAVSSTHLQFYRPAGHQPPVPSAASPSERISVKRAHVDKHPDGLPSAPSAKRKCVTLAAEDWDLLNSY